MKTAEPKTATSTTDQKQSQPFFSKNGEGSFFGEGINKQSGFFKTSTAYHVNSNGVLQTKLSIGQPNDKYEKEADEMADKVVQGLVSPEESIQRKSYSVDPVTSFVRRKCTQCEEEEKLKKDKEEETVKKQIKRKTIFESDAKTPDEEDNIQRKCAECEGKENKLKKTGSLAKAVGEEDPLEYYGNKLLETSSGKEEKKESVIQKKSNNENQSVPDDFDLNFIKEKNNGGEALTPSVQFSMENSFGSDFSGIKIHNNESSFTLNEQIHARAFTHQNHIFFNENQYNPNSTEGSHLLAHELTHTLQQGGVISSPVQRKIGDGHDFPVGSRFAGNVILEDTFDNQRVVRKGSNGAHVTLIQQVLIARGYLLPTFGADGDFGSETERAVRAFQTDVGVGVDGVVGFRTIDFLDKRDRNAEVSPPVLPVVANTPFNVNNAIVQPGATPSNALAGCVYGLTFPENVQVRFDLINNAGAWQPVLREVVGNYSLQPRLVPGQVEVTGPGGNTTSANYCAQITELNRLGNCPGGAPPAAFYMLAAVLAHERVHASRFRNALIHPTVINPLETAIEGITRPSTGLTTSPVIAEFFIRIDPAFTAALAAARANWLARILVLVAGDHAAGGPTDRAEHGIVDPMVRRICNHARANGWPACPPLCP